jgi:uncharacterized protein (DUF3820 family)
MPFGIHKDKKLANVPADYLMWLYNENKLTQPLKLYIEEHLEILKAEEKKLIQERKTFNKNLYR